MKDLIERLRNKDGTRADSDPLFADAADAIEKMEAELDGFKYSVVSAANAKLRAENAALKSELSKAADAGAKQFQVIAGLRAEIEARWLPIESAPASAEYVLSLNDSGRMKIETGHWLRNMLYAAKVDGEQCNYTNWMPLPAAPGAQPAHDSDCAQHNRASLP